MLPIKKTKYITFTSPAEDLDCNHFESFLCDDFLISRVMPEGLQGNTWLDLHITHANIFSKSEREREIVQTISMYWSASKKFKYHNGIHPVTFQFSNSSSSSSSSSTSTTLAPNKSMEVPCIGFVA